MQRPELDIARNVKVIELLKSDMVGSLGDLFKAMITGNMEKAYNGLALMVINCFLLARRLGLNYGRLELLISDKTTAMLNEGYPLEEWQGDLASFKEYLEMKR